VLKAEQSKSIPRIFQGFDRLVADEVLEEKHCPRGHGRQVNFQRRES
jgi:hypothetical protein